MQSGPPTTETLRKIKLTTKLSHISLVKYKDIHKYVMYTILPILRENNVCNILCLALSTCFDSLQRIDVEQHIKNNVVVCSLNLKMY